MLRMLLSTGLLLALCGPVVAQGDSFFPSAPVEDSPSTIPQAANPSKSNHQPNFEHEIVDDELSADPPQVSGPSARLRVFLNEAPGEWAAVQMQYKDITRTKTVYEAVRRNGEVVRVPRTAQETVRTQQESVTGNAIVIDCEKIDVQVEMTGAGEKQFGFEIPAALVFRKGGMKITAESATLSASSLTMKQVSVHTNETVMKSDEMTIELHVHTLRIGDPQAAVPAAPTPAYQDTPFDGAFRPIPQATSTIPQSAPQNLPTFGSN